jgi:hypothetical protein
MHFLCEMALLINNPAASERGIEFTEEIFYISLTEPNSAYFGNDFLCHMIGAALAIISFFFIQLLL